MVVSVGDIATVMAYKLAHVGQAITNSCHITGIHFRVICSHCVCVDVHVVSTCVEVGGRGREWRGRGRGGISKVAERQVLLTSHLL